jgi:hypothetical protein
MKLDNLQEEDTFPKPTKIDSWRNRKSEQTYKS